MEKIRIVKEELENLKVEDLAIYNLIGHSPFFDYIVIATVNTRQSDACVAHLKKELDINQVEGKNTGWQVVDLGDVIVHLFDREKREFYGLDKLLFEYKE